LQQVAAVLVACLLEQHRLTLRLLTQLLLVRVLRLLALRVQIQYLALLHLLVVVAVAM
jgi:hypothetical protein